MKIGINIVFALMAGVMFILEEYCFIHCRRHYTDSKLKEIAKILKRTTHRDSVLEYIVEDFSVMSDFEIHGTCSQFNVRQGRFTLWKL